MEIILTAPATEMSDHNGKEFLGFATCTPPSVVPVPFLKRFFYPKVKINRDGSVKYAPYGLRKIEAILKDSFEVIAVHPDDIEDFISDAKVVGISAMDPLGYGPVSTTFTTFLGGEAMTRIEFLKLLDVVREYDCKIVVGGAGAWQLLRENLDVDCIVIGEAEKVVKNIFEKLIRNEDVPKVVYAEKPDIKDIRAITGASINGLVEVSRGCSRHCRFCTTAGRKIDFPIERILEEVKLNIKEGTNGVLLHAEDVLVYGSRLIPSENVIKLFREVSKVTKNVGVSHVALASVAAKPDYVTKIMEILELDFLGVQTGVETGSSELLRKYMPSKAYPFKIDEWADVVEYAFGVMKDNSWVPAATLMIGLPDERDEDLIATIELIERLKDYPSLLAPLIFVPMLQSAMKDYARRNLEQLHFEIIERCIKHNLKHVEWIMSKYMRGLKGFVVKSSYYGLKRWIEKRLREIDWKEVKKLSG